MRKDAGRDVASIRIESRSSIGLCLYLDQFLFALVVRLIHGQAIDGHDNFAQLNAKLIVALANTGIETCRHRRAEENANNNYQLWRMSLIR